jgi:hypothetical protein
MSKMQGDDGLSKCQQFGISPVSRLRLWRWPEHIFDDASTMSDAYGDGRSIFSTMPAPCLKKNKAET